MNDINQQLFDAVEQGDTKRVSDLLEKGANVNAQHQYFSGQTPLHRAVFLRYPGPMVKLLVNAGADIEAKDEDGKTAWEIKKEYVKKYMRYSNASYPGVSELMKPDNMEGQDIGAQLYNAVKQGDTKRVFDLLEKGANPNAIDEDGETPLHWAVWLRHPEPMARILVDAGADIEAKDEDGKTAWDRWQESWPMRERISKRKTRMARPLGIKGAEATVGLTP